MAISRTTGLIIQGLFVIFNELYLLNPCIVMKVWNSEVFEKVGKFRPFVCTRHQAFVLLQQSDSEYYFNVLSSVSVYVIVYFSYYRLKCTLSLFVKGTFFTIFEKCNEVNVHFSNIFVNIFSDHSYEDQFTLTVSSQQRLGLFAIMEIWLNFK